MKKNKNLLFLLSFVGIVIIGLYLNHIIGRSLPVGEDELYYFGLAKKTLAKDLSLLEIWNLRSQKQLLFYLLASFSKLIPSVEFFKYFNFLHILFYVAGLASFYRISSIIKASKFSRLFVLLFYISMVSSTVWLGPRYFVPYLWLYIAVPNLVYTLIYKKYIEGALWIFTIFLFYPYGLMPAVAVGLFGFMISLFKGFKKTIVATALSIVGFFVLSIGYIGKFITKDIGLKGVLPIDLVGLKHLEYLFFGLMVVALVILTLKRKQVEALKVNIFCYSIFLFSLYCIPVLMHREYMAAYRLTFLLFVSIAVMLSLVLSLIQEFSFSLKTKIIFYIILLLTIFVLISDVISQNSRDMAIKPILKEEVEVFNIVDQICEQRPSCHVISDENTLEIGSYFSKYFANPTLMEYENMSLLMSDFDKEIKRSAKSLGYSDIIFILSKRANQIFDGKARLDKQPPRSYGHNEIDPLENYTIPEKILENMIYSDRVNGLYVFRINLIPNELD